MKVAIVHEMLVKLWGAEKVVSSLVSTFPDADLYTLIYDEKSVGKDFPKDTIHSSVFKLKTQKIYNLLKKQRLCLPFMAQSIESLDFSTYDVVIVSSSGFAHGIITKPETRVIVYYHSPARYLWDWTHEYRKDIGFHKGLKGYFFWKLLKKLRMWDYIASRRHEISLSNSSNTAERVQKYYRKESDVVYPPVETKRFTSKPDSIDDIPYHNYYIILSALTEFKKIDIAIQAFNKLPETKLVIIGDGNYRSHLESLTEWNNINFVGAKYWDELVQLVQQSQWLIFPWEEDFGIVPIECMAAWKPVFALKKWGLTESVIAGKTWDFFEHEDGADFIEKFWAFHANVIQWTYTEKNCIAQAKKFDEAHFQKTIKKYTQK